MIRQTLTADAHAGASAVSTIAIFHIFFFIQTIHLILTLLSSFYKDTTHQYIKTQYPRLPGWQFLAVHGLVLAAPTV